MRRLTRTALLLALSLVAGCQAPRVAGVPPSTADRPTWDVCFSPRGGCTQLIVDTIAGARSTVLVQAYSFTSQPIAQTLVEAHSPPEAIPRDADESFADLDVGEFTK